jgi:hypothetical protein
VTRRRLKRCSEDGGQSYRQILVEEYNFSPGGATYQRERLIGLPNLRDIRGASRAIDFRKLLIGSPFL